MPPPITIFFLLILAIATNCNIIKRQIVFPDDSAENESSGIRDRYGRVDYYGRPVQNQYHYGFDRHFNRRPQWQQQRPYYPQQNQQRPQFQNIQRPQNLQQQQPSQQVMSTSVSPQVQGRNKKKMIFCHVDRKN